MQCYRCYSYGHYSYNCTDGVAYVEVKEQVHVTENVEATVLMENIVIIEEDKD